MIIELVADDHETWAHYGKLIRYYHLTKDTLYLGEQWILTIILFQTSKQNEGKFNKTPITKQFNIQCCSVLVYGSCSPGQLLTQTLAQQAYEKVGTCSPVNF